MAGQVSEGLPAAAERFDRLSPEQREELGATPAKDRRTEEPQTDQPQDADQVNAQLEKLVNDRLVELERKMLRAMQSQVGRSEHRVTKALRAEFAALETMAEELKAAGVELKPEVLQAIRSKRVADTLAGDGRQDPDQGDDTDEPEDGPDPRQDQQAAYDALVASLVSNGERILAKYGLDEIPDDAPEFKKVDLSGDPLSLLASLESAAKAYSDRIASEQDEGEDEQEPPPRPRRPARGRARPEVLQGDSLELIARGYANRQAGRASD